MSYQVKSILSLFFVLMLIISLPICAADPPEDDSPTETQTVDDSTSESYKVLFEESQNETAYYKEQYEELYENGSTNISNKYITNIKNELTIANEQITVLNQSITKLQSTINYLSIGIFFTFGITLIEFLYVLRMKINNGKQSNDDDSSK
ncbi:hypothetical protein [Methanohalophilus portucalensis]|uniref:Uncharacterized protein n=3 Tax=Methanohalophilus portucalensis TaxID=39664 RepID=A0A1X7NCT0_9EURY|nr:hypothetical protein [Methanohalophilus portucalensis]ATU08338.1 hypothetical protein BKM01_05865 [Methanohalophilus portucalensis]RNI13498.1 hypothetical protein EFE41_02655 [Methanohalophilus portucalensis FDF-1]SMH34718.1 hypothetical protein SAMN06264941_0885 [Methanohalophilus portucalensis FDF-1]